jgi:8-oxo-dGTP diphosphatase
MDPIRERNDAVERAQICIPVVSAIIERIREGQKEILVQTRHNPQYEPEYTGTLEIPAGWIDCYESVYDALRREVYEETGLTVTKIHPDERTSIHTPQNDGAFAFFPFCCQQQIRGGKPWIGFVFLCEVEDKEPNSQTDENKDLRWMKKESLAELFKTSPDKIFTLQLGVIEYYLSKR